MDAEKARSCGGRNVAPMVYVVARSTLRFGLPPWVTFANPPVGLLIVPMLELGAPWAMQSCPRLLFGVTFGPAHGSTWRLSKFIRAGVNSSPILGARDAT